jgi:hypothetical protein
MLRAVEMAMIDKAAADMVRRAADIPASHQNVEVPTNVLLPLRSYDQIYLEEVAQFFNECLEGMGWKCNLGGDDIRRLGKVVGTNQRR